MDGKIVLMARSTCPTSRVALYLCPSEDQEEAYSRVVELRESVLVGLAFNSNKPFSASTASRFKSQGLVETPGHRLCCIHDTQASLACAVS
jgi:hypothetical protein